MKRERGEEAFKADKNYDSPRPPPFFFYTDRSHEPDDNPHTLIVPFGGRLNLPAKLLVILSQHDLAETVSWMPHGRSWRVHNPEVFTSQVMPQFWEKCSLASFYRQVKAWGFRRISKGIDKNSYYHEYFLRGLPHLCKKMHSNNNNIGNAFSMREYEPDLYAISEMHPVPKTTKSIEMEMLRKSMLAGPNARMAAHHSADIVQQDLHRVLQSNPSREVPLFTEADEQRENAMLTPEEIAARTADMYGLAESLSNCSISEDDFLPEALYMLDAELNKIPTESKTALLMAQERCPELIDDKHKETFLWSENLDARLAAQRLVKYWEKKQKLFGPVKFLMPMTLDGALRDDLEALSAVGIRVLPIKDTAGRAILCYYDADFTRCNHASLMRAAWYIKHAVIEDTEVQKRGVVHLVFAQSTLWDLSNLEHRRYIEEDSEIDIYFPARLRAVHVIQPSPVFQHALSYGKVFMNKEKRQRIHSHTGSNENVLQSLSNFGFLLDQLPSEIGGNIALNQNEWIGTRMAVEHICTTQQGGFPSFR